jgi:osmotically-inducible protein OsmY
MKKLYLLLAALASLNLVSCAAPEGRTGRESYKNYGEQIEDTKIVSFIKHKFRSDPLIPHNLIHISVDRGIVQLSGFVKTHQEGDLALLNVRNTLGVKDVINNLVIMSGGEYANRRATAEKYNTAR